MREKLIEILRVPIYPHELADPTEVVADYLLDNDVVPVVRCKNCKHGIWDKEEQMWECIVGVDLTGDPDTYAMFHEYNDGAHFCSYGERKDNGTV